MSISNRHDLNGSSGFTVDAFRITVSFGMTAKL